MNPDFACGSPPLSPSPLSCWPLQGTHTKKLTTASDMSALFETAGLEQLEQQQQQRPKEQQLPPRSRL
jgi:hypothetical protein